MKNSQFDSGKTKTKKKEQKIKLCRTFLEKSIIRNNGFLQGATQRGKLDFGSL